METFSLQRDGLERGRSGLFTAALLRVISLDVDWAYLLQGGLQERLPLLGIQQQTLPAAVELVQLIPQVAGLVARRGLQQLGGGAVHSLHRGMMGQHVVT